MNQLTSPQHRNIVEHLLSLLIDDFATRLILSQVCAGWRKIVQKQDLHWFEKLNILYHSPPKLPYLLHIDYGLNSATTLGYKDLALFYMGRIGHLREVIRWAIHENQRPLIDLCIELGFSDWVWAIVEAIRGAHQPLADFFQAKLDEIPINLP